MELPAATSSPGEQAAFLVCRSAAKECERPHRAVLQLTTDSSCVTFFIPHAQRP